MKLTNFLLAVVALIIAVGLWAVSPKIVQAHQTANPSQSSCFHSNYLAGGGVTTCCHENYCSGSNVKNVCITCRYNSSPGLPTDWTNHSNCYYSNLPALGTVPTSYGDVPATLYSDSAYDDTSAIDTTHTTNACSTVCGITCQVITGPTNTSTVGTNQMLAVTSPTDYQCTTQVVDCPTGTRTSSNKCGCDPDDPIITTTSGTWRTDCGYGSNTRQQNWCAINSSCVVNNWVTASEIIDDISTNAIPEGTTTALPLVRCPQGTRLINRGTTVTSTDHPNKAKFSGSSYCVVDASSDGTSGLYSATYDENRDGSCTLPTCSGLGLTPTRTTTGGNLIQVFPSILGASPDPVDIAATFTASTSTSTDLQYARKNDNDSNLGSFTSWGYLSSGETFAAPATAGYYQIAANTYSSDCSMFNDWKGYWKNNVVGTAASCPASRTSWSDLAYRGNGCKAGLTVVDFGLVASDTNGATTGNCTATQGGTNSTCSTITVSPSFGFNSTVGLSVAVPTGVAASISTTPPTTPTSLASAYFTTGAVLNVTATGTCATTYPCSKTITITGSATVAGTTRSKTVDVTLNVTAPTPDFTISADPASRTITVGQTASYAVTARQENAFDGTVRLTAPTLPSGAAATFYTGNATCTSATATINSQITLSAAALSGCRVMVISGAAVTSPASPNVTVRGTSGTLSHDASVTLTVNAAGVVTPPPPTPGTGFIIIPLIDIGDGIGGVAGDGIKNGTEACFSDPVTVSFACTSASCTATRSPLTFTLDAVCTASPANANVVSGFPSNTTWRLTITALGTSPSNYINSFEPTPLVGGTWYKDITIPP